MKRIGLINLGCPKNTVDLEVMLSFLDNYTITLNIKEADYIFVNTCAFIKDAREETINTIQSIIRQKRKKTKVIIAGCFVSKDINFLKKRFKNVYAWIGVNDLYNIKKAFEKGGTYINSTPFIYNSKQRRVLLNHYSAYVKISEGCNHKCSFCVIPFIKGKYRSRKMKDIVDEVVQLVKAGVKEINLISQDTSYYGKDIYGTFYLDKLLKKILKRIKKYFWLRIMYLYPNLHMIKKIVGLMKKDKRICRYFDLPFQHVNDAILLDMRRGYLKKDIKNIIEFIKYELPNAIIRSSFITGYPGETEEIFKELLFFIKSGKIDKPGIFKYSDEFGTVAYKKSKKLNKRVINKRYKILINAVKNISISNKNIKIKRVLITGIKKKNLYIARTQENAPDIDDYVLIDSRKKLKIGNFYNIKIG